MTGTELVNANISQAIAFGMLTKSIVIRRPIRSVRMPDSRLPMGWPMKIVLAKRKKGRFKTIGYFNNNHFWTIFHFGPLYSISRDNSISHLAKMLDSHWCATIHSYLNRFLLAVVWLWLEKPKSNRDSISKGSSLSWLKTVNHIFFPHMSYIILIDFFFVHSTFSSDYIFVHRNTWGKMRLKFDIGFGLQLEIGQSSMELPLILQLSDVCIIA